MKRVNGTPVVRKVSAAIVGFVSNLGVRGEATEREKKKRKEKEWGG
jgi:hypothetical protein